MCWCQRSNKPAAFAPAPQPGARASRQAGMQAGGLVGGRGGRTAGAQATRGVRSQGHQAGPAEGQLSRQRAAQPAVVADDVILEGWHGCVEPGWREGGACQPGRAGGWVGGLTGGARDVRRSENVNSLWHLLQALQLHCSAGQHAQRVSTPLCTSQRPPRPRAPPCAPPPPPPPPLPPQQVEAKSVTVLGDHFAK